MKTPALTLGRAPCHSLSFQTQKVKDGQVMVGLP